MSENNGVPLFQSLRTDPKKSREGVWVEHPDSGDAFLLRREWCPEHLMAYAQAKDEHALQHGDDDGPIDEDAAREIDAIATATGLVVDWKIKNDPERTYDSAAMAAALADPELDELRIWIKIQSKSRQVFRPEALSGN